MSELEIVSGCCQNDNFYRRQLYEHYAQQMMGICYRYTGDSRIAEDLLHDGFIKIFESINSFQYRGMGSLKAWMSKIFTNISLEHLRKSILREPIPLEEWKEVETIPEEVYEPIPNDALMQMITELPVGYRTVFNLFAFEELSHKEIAAQLNINESSSRSQLTRAKAMLTEKVKIYIRHHG